MKLSCMSKLISFSLQNPRRNYGALPSVIRDPKASVLPVLEQWVTEGGAVEKQELQSLVRLLKDFRRFNHALEISQWMTDRRVHGLENAEKYFNNKSKSLKSVNAYGALLSIYVQEHSVEKAEATMQKMKKMCMSKASFPYNMLINLHSQNFEQEKINMVMQEMEENGIPLDKYTLRN
ncbi:pentatricopeptide repeat-containing protein [Prunus yedoensis var. nudiflora]|uniref:Pentatricopeptide repeat-containing protein n=1 Tax=Prunus yedoensis var. nudiflora TaxID=2094558 RepID=A0A314U8X1_PRUYE|nr:pentatricopeptide repeat-containing protein [Prunus yedoensis var. nudiflora]